MLFNSIDFAVFLPIVFIFYWFICNRNLKLQNFFLVVASYVFYGWWDYRFLSLIFISTMIDFLVGKKLATEENQRNRKTLLWISILFNVGFLGFFKYYNFFLENFIATFSLFGVSFKTGSLKIILPVGISFYTFQTMSYTIDVYKNKLKPTNDFIAFSAFVSFFPQLVAGPIERASNLLPQFYTKRNFDYSKAADGMRQILWGLFKKVVIADNCAEFANQIFNNSDQMNGSALALGSLFFTFQIYGDFSGYSDIAIGTSRLFGFNLMRNFAYPYFSRDIAEFWRRWHISLSTWFRDYLYIPLGGSRGNTWMKVRNTFVIFIVSGFWHGANWTFVIWGLLNAIYFMPLLLTNKNRNNLGVVAQDRHFPSVKDFFAMLTTFLLTVVAWIFFRAQNVTHAIHYMDGIFSKSLWQWPNFSNQQMSLITIILTTLAILVEWVGRRHEFALEGVALINKRTVRWTIYSLVIFMIGVYMKTEESPFIYFQF